MKTNSQFSTERLIRGKACFSVANISEPRRAHWLTAVFLVISVCGCSHSASTGSPPTASSSEARSAQVTAPGPAISARPIETTAVELVYWLIKRDQVYGDAFKVNCANWMSVESWDYVDVEIQERHGGSCPGDEETDGRVMDNFRVMRDGHTVLWRDISSSDVNSAYQPYAKIAERLGRKVQSDVPSYTLKELEPVMRIGKDMITFGVLDAFARVKQKKSFDELTYSTQEHLFRQIAALRFAAAKAVDESLGQDATALSPFEQFNAWSQLNEAFFKKHPLPEYSENQMKDWYRNTDDDDASSYRARNFSYESVNKILQWDRRLDDMFTILGMDKSSYEILMVSHTPEGRQELAQKQAEEQKLGDQANPRLQEVLGLPYLRTPQCMPYLNNFIFLARRSSDLGWNTIYDAQIKFAMQMHCLEGA